MRPLSTSVLILTSLFIVACGDGPPSLVSSPNGSSSAGSRDSGVGTDGGPGGSGGNLGEPPLPGTDGSAASDMGVGGGGSDGGAGGGGGGGTPGGGGGGGGGTPGGGGGGGTPGGGGGGGDADAGTPTTPRGPAELMFYTANVENLPRTSDGCPGDWKDLFAYMATQIAKPDVFLVQQVTDQAQLGEITAYMTANLGRPYAGLIAEADPVPFNSPCGAQKEKQTNAIVYASDRMQAASSPTIWRSYKNVDGACVLDSLSRTRGIAVKLLDMVSNEYVSVASIHWSTRNGLGLDPACAFANATETNNVLRANHPDATLYVFGGDTNEPDTADATTSSAYNGWYAETNGQLGGGLGYIDPIWQKCQLAGNLRPCLLDNWTFNGNTNRRIDYLFARRNAGEPGFLRAHTITFNEAGDADQQLTGTDSAQGYSDHRSVLMRLSY